MLLHQFTPATLFHDLDGNSVSPVGGSARYDAVMRSLDAMTTPNVMHLLNSACRLLEPGEIYLEIGCYRGSTLIGALLGNDAHALAVDDRSNGSPDGKDNAAEFWRAVEAWNVETRLYGVVRSDVHAFFRETAAATDEEAGPPVDVEQQHGNVRRFRYSSAWQGIVGVLLLDGNHANSEDTYRSLRECIPLLAKRALIIMDDGNMEKIHTAAARFVETYAQASLILDRRTPGHMHHTFWNGSICIGWEGQ
jgi:predicted O-methyltransferase YrrM